MDLSVPVATIGTSTNARLTFGPEEVAGGTACSTSVLVPGPGDTGAQCAKISRLGIADKGPEIHGPLKD